jgi:hypothetical protein
MEKPSDPGLAPIRAPASECQIIRPREAKNKEYVLHDNGGLTMGGSTTELSDSLGLHIMFSDVRACWRMVGDVSATS